MAALTRRPGWLLIRWIMMMFPVVAGWQWTPARFANAPGGAALLAFAPLPLPSDPCLPLMYTSAAANIPGFKSTIPLTFLSLRLLKSTFLSRQPAYTRIAHALLSHPLCYHTNAVSPGRSPPPAPAGNERLAAFHATKTTRSITSLLLLRYCKSFPLLLLVSLTAYSPIVCLS